MKMKAIIVDDERLARNVLRSLLEKASGIEIIGEAENISQAVNLVQTKNPDVVFLDIQLSGETGFDLFEEVPASFKTIFVTAFDEYAIRAFEVSALDYLLKPVNPVRLNQALEKLFAAGKDEEQIEKQKRVEFRPLEFDDRIFLETNSRSFFLKINRISHITSCREYTEVFTLQGQKFLIEKSLREWELRLPEKHFVRIHRSTIINIEHIQRIEGWFNRSYQIYLPNIPEPFVVSRRCAAKLKNKFG